MSNGNVAVEVDLNEHIERIDIVQDDSHATTYALVGTSRALGPPIMSSVSMSLRSRFRLVYINDNSGGGARSTSL